jgi:hypothetical protein
MCTPVLLPIHLRIAWLGDMGKLIDMIGSVFGRLTVQSRAPNDGTRAAWNCLCRCGSMTVVDGKKLRSGHTKSCGCYRAEVTAPKQGKQNFKHGKSLTIGYRRNTGRIREIPNSRQIPSWANMDRIMEIYENRPDGHHVDHIIPLRGKYVCGFHVENNLQYLTASENMRKHNTYEVQ